MSPIIDNDTALLIKNQLPYDTIKSVIMKKRQAVKKSKTTKKHNVKKILSTIAIIFFSCGLILSSYNIIKYILENNTTNSQLQDINEKVTIELVDDSNTEVVEQANAPDQSDPYWDYIKTSLINVNFKELLSINNQTRGWIQVGGTNINYPFVQGNNNDYYLNHSFNKEQNSAGWVFLDYRNSIASFSDKNTILYAHGRLDHTMFGSLRNILSSGWLNNRNNHIIKLSTEYENTLWQVFSVYRIPTTSDYLRTSFVSSNDFRDFIKMLHQRSAYDFNTLVSESDRILTLSTCYNDADKVVLHAKLIKRENK